MPALSNPRHEAFVRARAKGATLVNAYEDAGFTPDRAHACRLAKDPNVAERLSELRAQQAGLDDAGPFAIMAALLRVAKAAEAEAEATPASHKEVRLTLLEVDRLRGELLRSRDRDLDTIEITGILNK